MSDTFGGRLRKVRKQFGLTQKLFGEKLGVSLPTINRLEQSDVWPHEEFLLKLRAEFNCDPTWILTGQDEERNRTETVNASVVRRDHHVYTLLKSQRDEWLAVVLCTEQISLNVPENERVAAEEKIRVYRERIDYLNALLNVGHNEDSEENKNS